MKKLKLLLSIFIGLSMLSCSSDDDNTQETTSKFTIDGTEYATPNGHIISYYDGSNSSSHAIYLLNGNINNNEWYGETCDFSTNLTQGVIFNIRSTSTTELAAGTYNYALNTFEPSLNETNIATNVIVTNNCVTSSDSIDEDQITSGNLVVEISGNIYTLSFTFQTIDFGTVPGTYVGELQLVQDLS